MTKLIGACRDYTNALHNNALILTITRNSKQKSLCRFFCRMDFKSYTPVTKYISFASISFSHTHIFPTDTDKVPAPVIQGKSQPVTRRAGTERNYRYNSTQHISPAASPPCKGGFRGPRVGLNGYGGNLLPLRFQTLNLPSRRERYTDWALWSHYHMELKLHLLGRYFGHSWYEQNDDKVWWNKQMILKASGTYLQIRVLQHY